MSIVKIEKIINHTENTMSKLSAIPIAGTIVGVAKILMGITQTITSIALLCFASIPARLVNKNWSLSTHCFSHIKHGFGNVIAGSIEAIPIIGTIVFLKRRKYKIDLVGHERKFMPYLSLMPELKTELSQQPLQDSGNSRKTVKWSPKLANFKELQTLLSDQGIDLHVTSEDESLEGSTDSCCLMTLGSPSSSSSRLMTLGSPSSSSSHGFLLGPGSNPLGFFNPPPLSRSGSPLSSVPPPPAPSPPMFSQTIEVLKYGDCVYASKEQISSKQWCHQVNQLENSLKARSGAKTALPDHKKGYDSSIVTPILKKYTTAELVMIVSFIDNPEMRQEHKKFLEHLQLIQSAEKPKRRDQIDGGLDRNPSVWLAFVSKYYNNDKVRSEWKEMLSSTQGWKSEALIKALRERLRDKFPTPDSMIDVTSLSVKVEIAVSPISSQASSPQDKNPNLIEQLAKRQKEREQKQKA